MDIHELEHCSVETSCLMPPSAVNFGRDTCVSFEQHQPQSPPQHQKPTHHSSPQSTLNVSQSLLAETTVNHNNHHQSRNGTGNNNNNNSNWSPYKSGSRGNNENNGNRNGQSNYRQPKGQYRPFNSINGSHHNSTVKSGGMCRRNNSVSLHSKHHQQQQGNDLSSSSSTAASASKINEPNSISKTNCDTNGKIAGNGNKPFSRRNASANASHNRGRKNSKVDKSMIANNAKNYKRSSNTSLDDSVTSRPKKARRSRRRKRPVEQRTNGNAHQTYTIDEQRERREKRMRWTECNAEEVSRLHRNCMQKGQPLAPYNTTQFIMNEHNAEKEINFDELSGQITQMHNNRKHHNGEEQQQASEKSMVKVNVSGDGSDCDNSLRDDDYHYSSPEDESYFLEQQFHEAYDTMHAERLNSMSKSDLLKEYLLIEKELESLRQKSPSSSTTNGPVYAPMGNNDSQATHSQLISMGNNASSPRHSFHRGCNQSRHQCNNNVRSLFKENKHLRKLLKQVYNRYNSLVYTVQYVHSTNSTNSQEAAGSCGTTNLDESLSFTSGYNQSQMVSELQLTNELHNRIEKYIFNPSKSSLSTNTSSSSSSSYTTTTTTSSSGATSFISEDDEMCQVKERSWPPPPS